MDKIDSINEYKVGDTINVKYNLKGREWTSPQGDVKFFNTLEVWNISSSSDEAKSSESQNDDLKNTVSEESGDDLPF